MDGESRSDHNYITVKLDKGRLQNGRNRPSGIHEISFKTLSNGILKVQSKGRLIRGELKKRNLEYHSHQLKSEESYRVVVGRLHTLVLTPKLHIACDMKTHGHEID